MDNQAMKDALLAANTALVEKIGKQPYICLHLALINENWRVGGAYLDSGMRDRFDGPNCESPEKALAGIMKAIRKMPSEAERNLSEFQKKVAEAIDFGNQHGIDGQWLNPLVETARALAKNALPAPLVREDEV